MVVPNIPYMQSMPSGLRNLLDYGGQGFFQCGQQTSFSLLLLLLLIGWDDVFVDQEEDGIIVIILDWRACSCVEKKVSHSREIIRVAIMGRDEAARTRDAIQQRKYENFVKLHA